MHDKHKCAKTLVQNMTDASVPDNLQVYIILHKNSESQNNYRTIKDKPIFFNFSPPFKCNISSLHTTVDRLTDNVNNVVVLFFSQRVQTYSSVRVQK